MNPGRKNHLESSAVDPPMPYFLALDAGGTKTIGVIGDSERELARAETGTIKVLRADPEFARSNLASLLRTLSLSSNVDLQSIARICIGISGIRAPRVGNWIKENIPLLAAGELLLCGDEEIALDAAFGGGAGILVVAGTGSNAVGRGASGKTARAGGWGPLLGDEGSGHWIGQEALRRALRAENEGHPSALLAKIAGFWQLAGIEELVERGNAAQAPDFSALAPLVASCAENGDSAAKETMERAGEELARLASLVIRRLREQGESASLRVAFAGSVLSSPGPVRTAAIETLKRSNPEIEVFAQSVDPVEGALWRARNGVR